MSSSTLSLKSTLPLPKSKHQIPRLGFGVYQSHGPTCVKSCLTALKVGYRHIDTAQYYANESLVGDAVRQSGIPRSEIFITTKILSPGSDADSTYQSVVDSVAKIDGGKHGYVDLFLIHSPNGGKEARKLMWQALERAQKEGKVRDIGVSNFGRGHIEELKQWAEVWPPAVNQIELHPWCQQRTAVSYCEEKGIVVEAYCPLVRNQKADDKTLNALAEKYQKSTGQILIRYCLQKGWVPLPKSDTPSRIEANADVYGFDISKEDMETLDGLDQGDKGAIVQAGSVDQAPKDFNIIETNYQEYMEVASANEKCVEQMEKGAAAARSGEALARTDIKVLSEELVETAGVLQSCGRSYQQNTRLLTVSLTAWGNGNDSFSPPLPTTLVQGSSPLNGGITEVKDSIGESVKKEYVVGKIHALKGRFDVLKEAITTNASDPRPNIDDSGAAKLFAREKDIMDMADKYRDVLGGSTLDDFRAFFDDYVNTVLQRNNQALITRNHRER
ncbi:hypothetical protein H2199_003200 [Coniosporium tulheliwenetii]|uniref:Uncharacterized protein n=1 Tax=Coniosporium tulheliwenetii TaxID=3383036 RepID=A0ACC2ZC66_9PEZI|nr:hypothetical protein H2199_003200 [Cladosporium sp. JES 115]